MCQKQTASKQMNLTLPSAITRIARFARALQARYVRHTLKIGTERHLKSMMKSESINHTEERIHEEHAANGKDLKIENVYEIMNVSVEANLREIWRTIYSPYVQSHPVLLLFLLQAFRMRELMCLEKKRPGIKQASLPNELK